MRIAGINGIRDDGTASTDLVLKGLSDLAWETVDVNYPRVSAAAAYFRGRSWHRSRQYTDARYLFMNTDDGDAVVAHSYGCLLTLRAMELGRRFSHVFFFGAAMNDNFTFPYEGMKSLDNIYNPNDKALGFGKLLIQHDFGPMGKTGYEGPPDRRISNYIASPDDHEFFEHSNYFLDANRNQWVEFIDNKLQPVLSL